MANNEDQNPDDMVDFEPEGDFSEFEDEKAPASFGDTVKNNPLIKLGLVAAGLIVVIGGILMFGGEDAKAPKSAVGSANLVKETPGTKELTPVMQEAMEEYNDQRIQEAVNQGGSVMPVPIEPPKTFLPVPTDAANNEDPLQRWRLMQEERLRVQREQEQLQIQQSQQAVQTDPAVDQAVQSLATGMMTQMAQIINDKQIKPLSFMNVTGEETEKLLNGEVTGVPGQTVAATGNMVMGPNGQLIPAEPLDIVIAAGSIVYAQLLNEANSDVPGPIVALVAQGPFSGSRVLGTFSKKEELLVLQFTTLVSKEGYSIPITAFAMDPDSTLVGMASDVDHRYFKRVILPAAAEFIQGIGEAIAEKGTTTVTVNEGDSTTSTQDNTNIDVEQELAKGVQNSFEKIGSILDEEGGDTEILVVVKAGTPMGLLFMESVTQQAINNAKFGIGAQGGQQQQQQQQQGNPFYGMIGMNGQQQGQYPYGTQGYPAQYGTTVPNNYGMTPTNTSATSQYMGTVMQGLQNQQSIQNGNP